MGHWTVEEWRYIEKEYELYTQREEQRKNASQLQRYYQQQHKHQREVSAYWWGVEDKPSARQWALIAEEAWKRE